MATLRITFEVDSSAMFDTLAAVNDGGNAIGVRLAGVLLTGEPSMADHLGMAVYGVKHVSTKKLEPVK